MYDKKLAIRIKNMLEDNIGKHYYLKELNKELKIRKHKHRDLMDTLHGLAKDEEIRLIGRKYTSLKKRLKQYITGRFDASSLARDKNFAFVIGDEFDVFISSEDILNAYHDDIVKVEVRQGKRNRQYGVIIKIVERSRKEVVGTVHQYNGKTFLDPDNSRIHTSIDIADIKQAVPGDKVVLSIKNWGSKEKYRLPIGDVKEILGKAGDPEVEVLSVIKHFNLPLEFPEQVMAAVSETSDIISEKEIGRRKDLRALNTITIDPASAKDFDDAVSFEKTADGFELFVHIADVAHYVPLDSPIFEEAFERGNSYYFPKRVIPMLPKRLSNDICSLRPREDKLTLTVYTKFDSDFNIVSNDIFQSVICSDRRFSYEEVDAYFAGEENDISSDIADILDNLLELSQFLSEKRRKNGYLHFDLPETEYVFDDEGHVIDLQRSKETDSHKLIENCMLIANEYTAKLLSNHRTLYRIHEKPTDAKLLQLSETMEKCNIKFELGKSINKSLQKLLERLSGENEHRVFDKMILRSMQKARYDTKNLGHFGLALKTYTHFTSPIRRLCDLIIHHQLKDMIMMRNSRFSGQELFDFAQQASECEIVANQSEREVDFKNKMLFMKKHLGEEFAGMVVGMKNDALLVELHRYPVVGVLNFKDISDSHYSFMPKMMVVLGDKKGEIYHLADEIKVFINRVDDDIYLGLAKE